MGVLGVAVATLIAQAISSVLVTIALLHSSDLCDFSLREIRIDWDTLKTQLYIGFPGGIQSSMYALSNLILQTSVNSLGTDAAAAWTAIAKMDAIYWMIGGSLGTAITTFVGQNYGAGKMNRVKKTYKIVLIFTLIIGIVSTLIFQLCPQVIINIFGSGNELYQEFARKTFKIYLSLMTVTCLVKMTAVFFQSIGKSLYAVIASLIRDIVCFIPFSILFSLILESKNTGSGINGILYAAPISDFISIFVILTLTISFFKKVKNEEIDKDKVFK